MSIAKEPEIILYDLASTKNVCFSPVVWRIRLMLNYKKLPYKTIFLEFPDIEPTLKELGIAAPASGAKYTVPAIQHVPTNTYMMDSAPIAKFLETTYPDPPVPLTSEIGREIEAKGRGVVGPVFRVSVMPREINILSPRAQEYFRRSREASLGHPLEDLLLDKEGEEKAWQDLDGAMRGLSDLLLTNKADGPFVLGAGPSLTDFFLTGSLQCARAVEEEIFQRHMKYPGFKQIYEACLPFMEKRD